MYTLGCRDFNINCNMVVEDPTIDGVLKKAQAHSKEQHPDAGAIMKLIGPEIAMALMKAKIRERK